jgi:hypothetical protein
MLPSTKAQISLNTSGLDIKNNYGSIAYSVGAPFYIQKGYNYLLNEGVQNGMLINFVNVKSSIKVEVYPNPTNNIVFFKVQNLNFNNLRYTIINSLGIEILKGNIINASTYVSLNPFPASVYYIKIYRDMDEILTYKVIKI